MKKSVLMASASSCLVSAAEQFRPRVTEPRDLTLLPGEEFWRELLFGRDDADPRAFDGLKPRYNGARTDWLVWWR